MSLGCLLLWGPSVSQAAESLASGPTPPVIVLSPRNQTVLEGQRAQYEVLVTGSMPVVYQWQTVVTNTVRFTNTTFAPPIVITSNSITATSIPGATSSRYLLFNVSTNLLTGYRVVVTNSAGAATSIVATLTVKPYTPRDLRMEAFRPTERGELIVPVGLAAQGDESQVAASFAFAPTRLTKPRVLPSSILSKVTVTTDDSQAAAGRLGLTFKLPSGTNALVGVHTLAEVVLDVVPGHAITEAALEWVSEPVAMGAWDTNNASIRLNPVVEPTVMYPGPPEFNPQSGLYTQVLVLLNPGAADINGMQVYAFGLTNDTQGNLMRLQNAVGSQPYVPLGWNVVFNLPYLEWGPLPAGGFQELTAELYVSDRRTRPTPIYQGVVGPTGLADASGTQVPVDRAEYRNGVFLVEFVTITNRLYSVQYKHDPADVNAVWKTAAPVVRGTGSRMQWMDNGPPKTESIPISQASRFYRIILQN